MAFSQPAKANRANLRRRFLLADEALGHALDMIDRIAAEAAAGERQRDRRAEKARRHIANSAAWLRAGWIEMEFKR